MSESVERQAGVTGEEKIEVTARMIEAGVDRLGDLLEASSGSAYVVEQVFLSMYSKACE
jgi:hypothetical protein